MDYNEMGSWRLAEDAARRKDCRQKEIKRTSKVKITIEVPLKVAKKMIGCDHATLAFDNDLLSVNILSNEAENL